MGNLGLAGFEAGEDSVKTRSLLIVCSMRNKCSSVMNAEVTAQAGVLEPWAWVYGFPMHHLRTKFVYS